MGLNTNYSNQNEFLRNFNLFSSFKFNRILVVKDNKFSEISLLSYIIEIFKYHVLRNTKSNQLLDKKLTGLKIMQILKEAAVKEWFEECSQEMDRTRIKARIQSLCHRAGLRKDNRIIKFYMKDLQSSIFEKYPKKCRHLSTRERLDFWINMYKLDNQLTQENPLESLDQNRIPPAIISYEAKNSELVPSSNKPIGECREGSNATGVFIHKKYPTLVIKIFKSIIPCEPLKEDQHKANLKAERRIQKEYTIGARLIHLHLVSVHQLYKKLYPISSNSNSSSICYKLVMEKVEGIKLSQIILEKEKNAMLSNVSIKKLIDQARDCCLYLFRQGVAWGDVNANNTFISNQNKDLKIIDFGNWRVIHDPIKRAKLLLLGSFLLIDGIIKCAKILPQDDDLMRKIVNEIRFPIIFFGEKIRFMMFLLRERNSMNGLNVYADFSWMKIIHSKLEKNNDEEMQGLLADYFYQVKQTFISFENSVNAHTIRNA